MVYFGPAIPSLCGLSWTLFSCPVMDDFFPFWRWCRAQMMDGIGSLRYVLTFYSIISPLTALDHLRLALVGAAAPYPFLPSALLLSTSLNPKQHLDHPSHSISSQSNHWNHPPSPQTCPIAYYPASSSAPTLKFRFFLPFSLVFGLETCFYFF